MRIKAINKDGSLRQYEKKGLDIRIRYGKIDGGFSQGILISEGVVDIFKTAYGKRIFSGKEIIVKNCKFDWEQFDGTE